MDSDMQVNTGWPSDRGDPSQIETLCDELGSRAEVVRQEQDLLEQLVAVNARSRPDQARRYRLLLDEAGARLHRFVDLIIRYCR
jgi:hypothetical protein